MLQLTGSSSEEGRVTLRVRALRRWALLWLAGLVVCGSITQWYASVNHRRIDQQFDIETRRLVDVAYQNAGNGSDSRARDGTGLGLAIAKSSVEQMGGQIGYVTEIGNGTTLYIDLSVVEQMRAAAN
jgi:signal transduction histidine kinase